MALTEGPAKTLVRHPVSLGSACLTATFLKTNGLKLRSYPYDWIYSSLDLVASTLSDGFATFLDRSLLRKNPGAREGTCGHAAYHPQLFNHHDPLTSEADHRYFVRCVERLYEVFARPASECKLFVFVQTNQAGPPDREWMQRVRRVHALLTSLTSNVAFLAIHQRVCKDGGRTVCEIDEIDEVEEPGLYILEATTATLSDGTRFGDEADDAFFRKIVFDRFEFDVRPVVADDDSAWVESQVRFWYGENVERILAAKAPADAGAGPWDVLSEMLAKSDYGRRVKAPLGVRDTTVGAVAAKYGDCGPYRFEENLRVLEDWIAHDRGGRMTEAHALPILMVDCIGPWVPLIGYNRVVKDPYAILWPLRYHVDQSVRGLADSEPFAGKIDRVVFRGALSGPLATDAVHGKSSRVDVVHAWKDAPWADLGISVVPPHVAAHPDFPKHADRVAACARAPLSTAAIMRHKYVLCVEGADISSGFGWALASNCVPIHPYPFRYEVFFFGGLEPWVHFVPVGVAGEGLDDAYAWCAAHPERCAAIAANGRAFMKRKLDPANMAAVKEAVVRRWDMRLL